jgi:multicomponent Na+:H+ antiporter subunit E
MTATTTFLWNLLLALVWALAVGELTVGTLGVGFLAGMLVFFIARRVVGSEAYARKIGKLLKLIAFFLGDLVMSNLRLAHDVATPNFKMRPGVLAIPLDVKSDGEIITFANFITLTPGTLSLDVSQDRKTLFIHSMYTPDAEKMKKELKEGLERRIIEVTR